MVHSKFKLQKSYFYQGVAWFADVPSRKFVQNLLIRSQFIYVFLSQKLAIVLELDTGDS